MTAIKHQTVVTIANNPLYEVSKNAWNDAHLLPGVTGEVFYADGASGIAALANAAGVLNNDGAGALSWTPVVSGVSSVSNSDGTLTISPTTGAVVASIALAHANTWTAQQTFDTETTTPAVKVLGTAHAAVVNIDYEGNASGLSDNGAAVNFAIKVGGSSSVNAGQVGVLGQGYTTQVFSEAKDTVLQSFIGKLTLATRGAFDMVFGTNFVDATSTNAERMRIISTGQVSISGGATPITPTAKLHIAAGSTTANTAPLKFNSGSLLTTAEAGAVEFLTDKFYGTITTSAARKEVALWDAAATSGRIPYVTTNGRLVDSAALTWSGTRLTATQSNNGDGSIMCQNSSIGSSAYAAFFIINSANQLNLFKLSTGYSTTGLVVADQGWIRNDTGTMLVNNLAAADIIFATGGSATTNERLRADSLGNVSIGNAALATTATDGFLYIPTCAGTPTGVPTTKTGRVPLVFDTTNNFLYVRNGGTWKKTTVFA